MENENKDVHKWVKLKTNLEELFEKTPDEDGTKKLRFKHMTILGIYVMATYLQTSRNVTLKSGMKMHLKTSMMKINRVKQNVKKPRKVYQLSQKFVTRDVFRVVKWRRLLLVHNPIARKHLASPS